MLSLTWNYEIPVHTIAVIDFSIVHLINVLRTDTCRYKSFHEVLYKLVEQNNFSLVIEWSLWLNCGVLLTLCFFNVVRTIFRI